MNTSLPGETVARLEMFPTGGQLEHLFILSLDLFCIARFDGYPKRLNAACERTLGFAIDELLNSEGDGRTPVQRSSKRGCLRKVHGQLAKESGARSRQQAFWIRQGLSD